MNSPIHSVRPIGPAVHGKCRLGGGGLRLRSVPGCARTEAEIPQVPAADAAGAEELEPQADRRPEAGGGAQRFRLRV